MQDLKPYDTNEILALIISVLIGTGAYLGFIMIRKNQNINIKLIIGVLAINLFVTYLFSGVLKIFKWGEYRIIILPFVAYAGQYLTDWFDKKYPKIFDAGLKKTTGLDIEDKQNNEEVYIEEPEIKDENYGGNEKTN